MTVETPHVFGEYQNLVGISHEPASGGSDVAVILLTAGMLHHVGPNRMFVTLSRQLAEEGTLSFRFDLSGIGESLAVGSNGNSLQRASQEIGEAMDYLQAKFNIKRFVLFGLCSGADDAFFAAQQDERIVGAALLDGCGYRTAGYYWQRLVKHYLPRTIRLSRWKNLLGRCFGAKPTAGTLSLGDDVREFPNQEVASQQLQRLVDRNVKLRFIYTGGVSDYFNHAGQFKQMFSTVALGAGVSWTFHPQADHVASLCEDRRLLIDEVSSWVAANWPAKSTKQTRSVKPVMAVPATIPTANVTVAS